MSYNPSDKPTVPQLCTGLSSVSDWQSFAIYLPGIETKHIHEIESDRSSVKHQKMALFEKWLNVHPSATWSDVNGALVSIDEVSLATSLVNQSMLTPPSQVSSPPPVQQQVAEATEKVKHLELNIAEEDSVAETLAELYDMFAQMIFKVKTDFISLVTQQPAQLQRVIQFAEDAVSLSQLVHLDASNIEEFFHRLHPYYDFLECRVITTIAKQFIGGEVVHDLQAHSSKAKEFRRTAPIKQLARGICQVFTGVNGNLPILDVKLESPWEDIVIEGLYVLIEHLLPKKAQSQCSLMNNIVIKPGCLLLQYAIRDSSMIDTIIQHVQSNSVLMTLIGVFQLAVDGRDVIQTDGDSSFSFNVSLLKAVGASNNVAVQFLIDIGADVNYQYDNGVTALMLAASANNDVGVGLLLAAGADTDIADDGGDTALMYAVMVNKTDSIHYLLQAGADVNIHNKQGGTALILACGGTLPPGAHMYRLSNDYSDAVRQLLSHGADPIAAVDEGDGVPHSALDIACAVHDSSYIVEVLLTDCNIPPEAVGRGLYWALLCAAVNTIKLLQPKIPDVDPLAIKLGVACCEGDTETVKSLIEQGVDPNTSIVRGLTPLMIASCRGHIDVVDTLLLQGVDVNKVDDVLGCTVLGHTKDDNIALKLGAVHGNQVTSTEGQVTPTNKSQGSSVPRLPPFIRDLIDKPFRSLKQTQQQLSHFNVF